MRADRVRVLILRAAGINCDEETAFAWPRSVFSLSHIAIPFRTDDLVYGDGTVFNGTAPALGALAPRGEAGVLLLTSNYFLRTRHNPFYAFQARFMTEWIETL